MGFNPHPHKEGVSTDTARLKILAAHVSILTPIKRVFQRELKALQPHLACFNPHPHKEGVSTEQVGSKVGASF